MLTFEIMYFTVWTTYSWNFSPFELQEYTSFLYFLKKTHTDKKLQIYESPLLYIYIVTFWQKDNTYRIISGLSPSLFILTLNTCLQYLLSSLESMNNFSSCHPKLIPTAELTQHMTTIHIVQTH